MRRTKIVCTIGPASSSPEMLRALIRNGMNVARLNFSHGALEQHRASIAEIRAASAELDQPVAVLADLQGPKLRVGQIGGDGVLLETSSQVTLTTEPIVGRPGVIPVQYDDLPKSVEVGHAILLDDGLIELRVLAVTEKEIRCRVVVGGTIISNKGINLPYAPISMPAITAKDREDLAFALREQVDWIAMSFVRTADDVRALQELIRAESAFGRATPLIAKIEKPEGVRNIDAILEASDGIMVARGDLGIESPVEEVPLVQKMIIAKCNRVGKPVITATQMLDSMMRNPRPTRAEASDVANAILDGSDAIMLSGETAIGKYPLEALRTMARIAEHTEQGAALNGSAKREAGRHRTVAEAVAHASCQTAQDLDAAAIITPTASGLTPRLVSMFRPAVPIVAVTPSPMIQRQLALLWGVYPLLAQRAESTDKMIAGALQAAVAHDLVKPGDIVVVTAGAPGERLAAAPTNLMKVQRIERILAQGTGIGQRVVRGRVRLIAPDDVLGARVDMEEIVVVRKTDRSFVSLVQRASGLITEEGDAASHAAILALELGVPAIVGVRDATRLLRDGQEITLDPATGRIYEGYAQF